MAVQMTKSQLIEKIAEENEIGKKDVKGVLETLATVGYKELKKSGVFLVPGFAKFVVIKKPATKARKGTNPFTGEKVTPPHIKSLQKQIIAADATMAAREGAAVAEFSGRIAGLTVNGDTLWLTENFLSKSKPDALRGGAVNTSSSLSTFTAKMADVENDKAVFMPCYLNYQSLGSWPAWMKLDGSDAARGGSLSWQTRGQKMRRVEDGPIELRGWIEAREPGFLKEPGI